MTLVADWTLGPEHLSQESRVDKAIGPRIKDIRHVHCDTTIKSGYLLINILITYYLRIS